MADGTLRVIQDIEHERRRQVSDEDWTPEHDDEHDDGSLAMAAVCYASPKTLYQRDNYANQFVFTDPWPGSWHSMWDKREYDGNVLIPNADIPAEKRRRNLVKAGALIVAEIERLDRAAAKAK